MPNIKSAKKRMIQSEKRRQRNVARKSAIKTVVKQLLAALEVKEFDRVQQLMRSAESVISRAKTKGVLHKNSAARKVSRLARRVAQAQKSAAAA